jgi:nucleotide-binding universal stress UspA family protein
MKRFKNILFVVDSELKGGDVFERAVSLAENNQASLTVVSILEEIPTGRSQKIHGVSMKALQDSIIDKLQLQLESLVTSVQNKIQVNTKVLTGTPFLALIREVLRHKRDLVIKAAEEGGVMDRLIGSTDMHILRKCPCPVWLMRSSMQGHYRKILAAVDFDPFENKPADHALNQQILEMSTSLALSEFCELHIIHAWHAYGESSLRSGFARRPKNEVDAYVDEICARHQCLLDKLVAEFVDMAGKEVVDHLKPKVHLVKGFARDAIPELVNKHQIDLVTMGTVGRTGIPGFLMGNSAETILNRINCSVLAIKPEGFVTPVTLEG